MEPAEGSAFQPYRVAANASSERRESLRRGARHERPPEGASPAPDAPDPPEAAPTAPLLADAPVVWQREDGPVEIRGAVAWTEPGNETLHLLLSSEPADCERTPLTTPRPREALTSFRVAPLLDASGWELHGGIHFRGTLEAERLSVDAVQRAGGLVRIPLDLSIRRGRERRESIRGVVEALDCGERARRNDRGPVPGTLIVYGGEELPVHSVWVTQGEFRQQLIFSTGRVSCPGEARYSGDAHVVIEWRNDGSAVLSVGIEGDRVVNGTRRSALDRDAWPLRVDDAGLVHGFPMPERLATFFELRAPDGVEAHRCER